MKRSEPDKGIQEVIVDALDFGISNPLKLDFGFADQKMISPNAVAFQFVAASIARRVYRKKRKRATSIIVDKQSQFNKAQAETHKMQCLISEAIRKAPKQEKDLYLKQPLIATFAADQVFQRGITGNQLTISNSSNSIGLQIVDVYLWLVNKIRTGAELPP